MPKHRDAAQEACSAGLAPTLREASITTRMVEAKPTITAVKAAETSRNQPESPTEGCEAVTAVTAVNGR